MSRHSHDAYFKGIFSDPQVAADAIRRVLDPVIADAIDELSDLERGVIEATIAPRVDPKTREVIMTTAQKLRAEGREEGREVGREEGRALMLLDLLRRRYGELPEAVAARVLAADAATRDQWLDRLFVATTLDELLAE